MVGVNIVISYYTISHCTMVFILSQIDAKLIDSLNNDVCIKFSVILRIQLEVKYVICVFVSFYLIPNWIIIFSLT